MKKAWLRFRLRREYRQLLKMYDEYPCGRTLAAYINPRVSNKEARIIRLMAALSTVDTEFNRIIKEERR